MSDNNIVHVAVAVIQNSTGQYFIAKRPKEAHQGGLWEFPGGKVEDNETVVEALERELLEEIGIMLIQATPLIKIHHEYHDKSVVLDVRCVNEFTGQAFGKEGQETCWINKNEFSLYDFPEANRAIINTIQLPDKYMITGGFESEKELLSKIQLGFKKDIKLIQFRAHHLNELIYFDYAKKIYDICAKENVILLLNTSIEHYLKYNASNFSHGLHLTSKEIELFTSLSLDKKLLISTSIHSQRELIKAQERKIDFVVLSPVNKTQSHPNVTPLGWEGFKKLVEKSCLPVYALGGMKEEDLNKAKVSGAQGIAAIGAFWDE